MREGDKVEEVEDPPIHTPLASINFVKFASFVRLGTAVQQTRHSFNFLNPVLSLSKGSPREKSYTGLPKYGLW